MRAKKGEKRENIILTEHKAKEFLKKQLPVVKDIVLDAKEIDKILKEKKYDAEFPVVLKISSDLILHKTEIDGVRIIYNEKEFFSSLEEFSKKIAKYKAKVLVEDFVQGEEIIIGLKKDETFGHIIGLGLGGIFTEIVKDISFRACPISSEDFDSMVNDLKFKGIFNARGKKLALEELKKIAVYLSKIPEKNKNILELDLNPVILNEKECKIADARIVFEK